MPNRIEHIVAGGIGAALLYRTYKARTGENAGPQEILASAASGAIFSAFPDILERPDGPDHRGFFHSIAALAGTANIGKAILKAPINNPIQKAFLFGGSVGYATHIILDLLTPKGVPLL